MLVGDHKVTGLETGVKTHLSELVDNFLYINDTENWSSHSIFINAFVNQAKTVLAIWFLGLTVIGVPLILVVVFLRGFALGFTVSFLCHEKAGTGILISFLSVLPQNLFYIPFLIIWAVIAVNFSLYILRGRKNENIPLIAGLITYCILLLAIMLVFLAGALVEAYLSPWFLELFF
jgi:stage II sporulation protein M